MEISGPVTVGVVEKDDAIGYELHVAFLKEFQGLSSAEQPVALGRYINELRKKSADLTIGYADRQGVLIILQVMEQLLPHVEANEIPLEETIIIEISPETALGSLTSNLMN